METIVQKNMIKANPTVQVKKNDKLPKVTEADIKADGARVLSNADQGIQTAVVGTDGKIRTVIGLNGFRYLPDPDPDPLEAIMDAALDCAREKQK
jgi:hypothetical protein